jgi:hypothetical protein
MSKSDKLLEKMRSNPRDDWRIDDLKVIAKRYGFSDRQPGTSHVIFSYKQYRLTVPSHKPIKPIYIKKFISMIDTIIEEQNHDY